jgi:hypothetical protein
MEDGWESGRESGRLTYSIDQESEADKLALQLIALSGYSVSEARKIMLHIHGDAEGAELRSAHQASHPTGPERLAAFDLYASLTPNRPYTASKSSSTPLPRTAKETYPTGYVYDAWIAGTGFYEGDRVRGSMTGRGKLTYLNGDIYEGDFLDNLASGHGKLMLGKNNFYIGEFKKGVKHGRGIEVVDGVTRRGKWYNDEFSHDWYVSEKDFDYALNESSFPERSGDNQSDLVQVDLNFETQYSCFYTHRGQPVVYSRVADRHQICPERIGWPTADSDLVFDKTQAGTIPLLGVSIKINKRRSNANTCAYKVPEHPSYMLIPKGTRAVCPQTYAY